MLAACGLSVHSKVGNVAVDACPTSLTSAAPTSHPCPPVGVGGGRRRSSRIATRGRASVAWLLAPAHGDNLQQAQRQGREEKGGARARGTGCPDCEICARGGTTLPRSLWRAQGTFNQNKFLRRKKECSDDQLTEIRDSFDLFVKEDKETTGGEEKIDAEDLVVVMRALGHEPRKEDLKRLVTEVDPDNSGQLEVRTWRERPRCRVQAAAWSGTHSPWVTSPSPPLLALTCRHSACRQFDGYLNIILNKMAERPSQLDLEKAFRLFDHEEKGTIDVADLKRIAGQIGEQIEDEELEDMIREADQSGTGMVGRQDFTKIVTSYARHYDGER